MPAWSQWHGNLRGHSQPGRIYIATGSEAAVVVSLPEESPAAARRRVRHALREAREKRELTQAQVAEAMEWSMSKVMRIETGEVTISPNDLRPLLAHLGIRDGAQVDALLQDAKLSRSRKQWWDQPKFREKLTSGTRQLIQYEIEAAAIWYFAATLIPGPLQSTPYARAILARWRGDLDDDYLDAQLDARIRRRQQLLSGPRPPQLRLLLDESLLLRRVGGPSILAEQFAELIRLAESYTLSVRVMPFSMDAPISNVASYDLLFFGDKKNDGDAVLYRETHKMDEVVDDVVSVRRHIGIFNHAWDASLDERTSMQMLRERVQILAPS